MAHDGPTTTWDLSAELDDLDRPNNKISRERLDPALIEPFTVEGIPSVKRIWEAGMCDLFDEMGLPIKFRDLISSEPGRRTCVFFIR